MKRLGLGAIAAFQEKCTDEFTVGQRNLAHIQAGERSHRILPGRQLKPDDLGLVKQGVLYLLHFVRSFSEPFLDGAHRLGDVKEVNVGSCLCLSGILEKAVEIGPCLILERVKCILIVSSKALVEMPQNQK